MFSLSLIYRLYLSHENLQNLKMSTIEFYYIMMLELKIS